MSTFELFFQHERPIDPQAVRSLYSGAGWWPNRTAEQIANVLRNDIALGAWDGDLLVGFVRIISDQSFHAYVEDVIVHPSYQRLGIGRLLMTRLLEALTHFETITLFCHAELVPFYEKQGFQEFPAQRILHRKQVMPPHSDIP